MLNYVAIQTEMKVIRVIATLLMEKNIDRYDLLKYEFYWTMAIHNLWLEKI